MGTKSTKPRQDAAFSEIASGNLVGTSGNYHGNRYNSLLSYKFLRVPTKVPIGSHKLDKKNTVK